MCMTVNRSMGAYPGWGGDWSWASSMRCGKLAWIGVVNVRNWDEIGFVAPYRRKLEDCPARKRKRSRKEMWRPSVQFTTNPLLSVSDLVRMTVRRTDEIGIACRSV